MEIQNLFDLLSKLGDSLNRLLGLVKEKQRALVGNDRVALEKCIKSEEQILVMIQGVEEERLKMIHSINAELGGKNRVTKISSIAEMLKGKIAPEKLKQLTATEKKIKSDIAEIMSLNKQNLFLIQHSRSFISETINTLLSSRKRSILDRKV
ncbi:MAG: flagellar protein FlgN [bacterium]